MSDDSIPPAQGQEGGLKHLMTKQEGGLGYLLTDHDLRVQDARLDVLIKQLHDSGVLARYRALTPFQDIHARLRGLHEQLIAAVAAGNVEHVVRGGTSFDAYMTLVLAMARASDDRPFVPVDLWPHVPPPCPYTAEARMALQAILNLVRESIGLFTPGKLLLNCHYRLLAAHLLVSHVEVQQARDLPPPYPWPFVIRLDAEDTPYLDRQPDLADEQRAAADRLETALRGSLKQAAPLPRGTRPAAVDRRAQKHQAQLEIGRVANELYKTKTPEAIVTHPTFTAALDDYRRTTGTPLCIRSGKTVLRYINLYRQAEGLPPLRRGPQPSH